MAERKKGPSRDDFESCKEDKLFGPYPSWKRWMPTLLKQIGEDNYENFDPKIQDYLHLKYVIHRKHQLHLDTDEDIDKIKLLEKELGGSEKIHSNPKVDFALIFINQR